MNNKRFLVISVFLSFLFLSCSFMYDKNTYVCILECQHGSVEVQCISENRKGLDFLLIAHPEEGYSLDINNLCIFTYSSPYELNKDYYIEEYFYAEYYDHYKTHIKPDETEKENQFTFSAEKNAHITVSALFTKK